MASLVVSLGKDGVENWEILYGIICVLVFVSNIFIERLYLQVTFAISKALCTKICEAAPIDILGFSVSIGMWESLEYSYTVNKI